MSLEGTEVAVKIAGEGAKQAAILIYAILRQQQKTQGKTRLVNMLKSGRELKVFAVRDDELKTFCRAAKNYGVLYCVLISHAPCEIKLGDNLPDNVNAKYEAEGKQIEVRQGLSAVDIFRSLTQEIGRAYLTEGDYKTLNSAFSVYCVSYMLCKRFGVAVDGISFNRLPDEYGWVDTSEIKVDLATMREVAKEITTDINLGLAEQEKKSKVQDKEAR